MVQDNNIHFRAFMSVIYRMTISSGALQEFFRRQKTEEESTCNIKLLPIKAFVDFQSHIIFILWRENIASIICGSMRRTYVQKEFRKKIAQRTIHPVQSCYKCAQGYIVHMCETQFYNIYLRKNYSAIRDKITDYYFNALTCNNKKKKNKFY